MTEQLTDQEIVRREKLKELYDKGIDPFGGKFVRTHLAKELHEAFGDKTKEELAELNKTVTIAGRVMTKRGKGKVSFCHIQGQGLPVHGWQGLHLLLRG